MFGMGTGVSPPLWSPEKLHIQNCIETNEYGTGGFVLSGNACGMMQA